jgi:hypothetical protein
MDTIHHVISTDDRPQVLGTLDLPFRLVPGDYFYWFADGESKVVIVERCHIIMNIAKDGDGDSRNEYGGAILTTVKFNKGV